MANKFEFKLAEMMLKHEDEDATYTAELTRLAEEGMEPIFRLTSSVVYHGDNRVLDDRNTETYFDEYDEAVAGFYRTDALLFSARQNFIRK